MEGSYRIEPGHGPELLREWFKSRPDSSVEFNEAFEPEADPSDGYVVAYEATFEPRVLNRPRIEVWITVDGCVAFGFEQRGRVQARLGKATGSGPFAAGIEPVPMSEGQLLSLMNLAAAGLIGLMVTSLPFVGVVSMRAFVSPGTKERMRLQGSSFTWLKELSGSDSPLSRRLEYQPW